jgi:hypothetical protein
MTVVVIVLEGVPENNKHPCYTTSFSSVYTWQVFSNPGL